MNGGSVTKLAPPAENGEQPLQPTFLFQEALPLEGKVVLVIRSDSSMGSKVARTFAKSGCGKIILHHSSSEESMENLANELSESGTQCILLRYDLSREDQISRLFDQVLLQAEGFDIVVSISNQGVGASLFQICDRDFRTRFARVMKEEIFIAQKTLHYIKRYGRLILIHSGNEQRSGDDIFR